MVPTAHLRQDVGATGRHSRPCEWPGKEGGRSRSVIGGKTLL
jgi:hypothetical protein